MLIIGLAGQAGVGKDEIANYLVRRYGFVKFAFSDALYHEVQQAFGLPDQRLLRGRAAKDTPSEHMRLARCDNLEFFDMALKLVKSQDDPLSPRQILQWWGTEFRRAQDEWYWVGQADKLVYQIHHAPKYPEHRPQLFVETGTRFENERDWIKLAGGNIWHIHRDGLVGAGDNHTSAIPLPVLDGERELWNNDTLERLYKGVDLLVSTGSRFVRVEPLEPVLPNGQYYSVQPDGHKMLCNADGSRSVFDDVDE